jgi:predicted AAA+ superfamily ATPase
MIKRHKYDEIKADLKKKIVILTGPRHCGKTTLSKQFYPEFDYLNYDNTDHRTHIIRREWDKKKPLVIFDELHKMDHWKRFLKGIYDVDGVQPEIIVTGSARLDAFRKVGDSLAGRFFKYQLNPFDIKELSGQTSLSPDQCLDLLLKCGGFPEPFFNGTETFYRKWKRHHSDIILRQDLADLGGVYDIPKLELLVELLRERVGGTVSYRNLARDLEKDPNTIKRWLQLLEDLYLIFKVTPYNKNIARSILKEPKYYFYDTAQPKDPAARLENAVACALLKQLHDIEDVEGYTTHLHFLRTKDGKELDFVTVVDHQPKLIVEVKQSDTTMSPAFDHFKKFFPGVPQVQLVKNATRNLTYQNGCRLEQMAQWLTKVPIDLP